VWDGELKEICLNVSFFLKLSSLYLLTKMVLGFTDNPELVVGLVVVFQQGDNAPYP